MHLHDYKIIGKKNFLELVKLNLSTPPQSLFHSLRYERDTEV